MCIGLYHELLNITCVDVLHKVKLRKADVAWKRTAEVVWDMTEEEKEMQVSEVLQCMCTELKLYLKTTCSSSIKI